ncbi:UNVERIFIED_CONTAM: Cysteine proteinase inhibitor 3 [Sesamum latifolium]|uniref:Cysteine proteinase inhibitor n=1 Tax=Sesamum latifolium TaxID=2727402 RepID=A0AAW2XLV8_9LAMI
MRLKNKKNKALYFILILAVIVLICAIGFWAGLPERLTEMNTLGGLRNMAGNSAEIERIGRFAVQQHNNNQNTFLEFARVVEAKEQVVAGKMYHLTLEVVDGDLAVKHSKFYVLDFNVSYYYNEEEFMPLEY